MQYNVMLQFYSESECYLMVVGETSKMDDTAIVQNAIDTAEHIDSEIRDCFRLYNKTGETDVFRRAINRIRYRYGKMESDIVRRCVKVAIETINHAMAIHTEVAKVRRIRT